MENVIGALEYGKDWIGMLKKLAEAESLVDVFLCANAYGHYDDRPEMLAETRGVRIVYVGEDFFVVGPRRPVHSSIIQLGWLAMIRIHEDNGASGPVSLVPNDDYDSQGISEEEI
ncbi:MAG: hypothetical protein ACFFAY_01540 [Promethearchaeota archaeon]